MVRQHRPPLFQPLKRWSVLLLGGLIGLTSCQPPSLLNLAPFSPITETQFETDPSPSEMQIDTKMAETSSAQLKLLIKTPSKTWQTQSNTSGSPNAMVSEIASFKLYLVDSGSTPNGPLTASYGPFQISANLTAGQQNLVFNHLRSSNQAYYVAILALDSQGQNLTQLNSACSINGENVSVSTQGGNGQGQLVVGSAPTYTVSSSAALEISLNLRDAIGASLDTQLSVIDGSSYQANDIAYFRAYLVDSNTGTPQISYGPFSINANLYNNTQSISILNLMPGSYYVALAAFNAQDTNLTNSSLLVNGQAAAVSTDGGDAPTDPGKITIGSNYSVSNSAALQVQLNLL